MVQLLHPASRFAAWRIRMCWRLLARSSPWEGEERDMGPPWRMWPDLRVGRGWKDERLRVSGPGMIDAAVCSGRGRGLGRDRTTIIPPTLTVVVRRREAREQWADGSGRETRADD